MLFLLNDADVLIIDRHARCFKDMRINITQNFIMDYTIHKHTHTQISLKIYNIINLASKIKGEFLQTNQISSVYRTVHVTTNYK